MNYGHESSTKEEPSQLVTFVERQTSLFTKISKEGRSTEEF